MKRKRNTLRMIGPEPGDTDAGDNAAGVASNLKAPFPWFGGKSRVADLVWDRFGNVANYVEPFAGSLAVLLGRPHVPRTETVNDLDCMIANFWRALSADPEAIAEHADWPVNEADLHARHLWLVNQLDFRERMKTDSEFYDVKVAGWWVWGISQWIGSGWCSHPEWTGKRPHLGSDGMGVNARRIHRKRPMISPMISGSHIGKCVNAQRMDGDLPSRQIPHLRDDGCGVNADRVSGTSQQIPNLRNVGMGLNTDRASDLHAYMRALAERLRRVRVCCGDWKRVTGPSVTYVHGMTGIFLDPPYDMRVVTEKGSGQDQPLYSTHDNSLSAEVRAWALENGGNPLLRIALCGYEGEHTMPESWECVKWKANGGYGLQRGDGEYQNAARERIWFSPACLTAGPLFQSAIPEEIAMPTER
jgi:hypothetical protein